LSKFTITAKTLFGLEPVLAAELEAIGATDIELLSRAVQYQGYQSLLYKSNLCLRTALRILKPIAVFEVHSEENLYRMVREIDWSQYLTTQQTFAISGTANSRRFTHSKYIALKTKDAIVDQFRDRTGIRPDVDNKDPDLWIDVRIADRTCTISLNSSGMTLAKRGYGEQRTAAPINEALAAGIILMTEWDKQCDFIDPMCGSGTFSIEAAMIAGNIPPGRLRHFNFEKWNDFDRQLWKKVREEAMENMSEVKAQIFANDEDESVVKIAKQNARHAKVDEYIRFSADDFFETGGGKDHGLVVMNPPYGERLEPDDIDEFYEEIGTHLKHHYEGYEAWIISGNLDALKKVGLKTSRKIALMNGKIPCKLHKYQLYKGTRKNPNDD
jgi:putative N6-adenine-specific DNA methylase